MATGQTLNNFASRIALSTAVYQAGRVGAREIAGIRSVGIEKIEISSVPPSFDYHNQEQVDEILAACQNEGVSVVAMHGPFKLPYRDTEEIEQVIEESLRALDLAIRAEARVYVAHFGNDDHAADVVHRLLDATANETICLTSENQVGQRLRPYVDLSDRVASPRFGMIVDIGHARDTGGINPFTLPDVGRRWLADCGSRLRHVHLHDSFDLSKKPDHRPPLHDDGLIKWDDVLAGLDDAGYTGDLVFEDGRGEDSEDWVNHVATFPQRYEEKYG